MVNIFVDLLLFCLIYAVILCVLYIHHNKRKRNNGDSDEDGGLPVFNPPELDLPPGICLPDGPSTTKREKEEVLV